MIQRRTPVEKYFAKRTIEKMKGLIHESLDRLVYHFKEAHASHQVVSLDAGFAALTSDIIHKYVFGFYLANLDKEGFNAKVRDSVNGLFQLAHIRYFSPSCRPL